MFTKLRFLLGSCLILLMSTCVFSQTQKLSSAEALQQYRESLSYSQSVSMKIQHRVDSNDNELFPQTFDIVFRRDRDNNRAEWIGKRLIFGSEGDVDWHNSDFVKDIADGNMLVSLEGARLTDGLDSRRVILWYKYTGRLKELLENPNWGGPLFGKMYGSNYKSVADLLDESGDLHIRNKGENINGVDCFVLEGTSKYGKVTAWIAPEKGYNAMKWVIEKDPHHLFNDTAISKKWPGIEGWQVLFNVKELNEIIGEDDTVLVPKLAYFTFIINFNDGTKNIDHFEYKTSNIQLEPDFEALEAFKIDLPDGIRVFNRDFPNVKFIWEKGKPVPLLDQSALDSIDYQIQQMNNADKTKSTREIKNTNDIPYESTSATNAQPEIQTNNADAQEVLSESHSLPLLVLVPIGLLIIAVLGWKVFCRLRT